MGGRAASLFWTIFWVFFVIQTIKIEENIKNTPDISLFHNIFLIKQSKLKYGIV